MPSKRTRYSSVDREIPDIEGLSDAESRKEHASWTISNLIEQTFPPEEPLTLDKIYYDLTRGLGLTKQQSSYLVKQAMERGYIKKGAVRE